MIMEAFISRKKYTFTLQPHAAETNTLNTDTVRPICGGVGVSGGWKIV